MFDERRPLERPVQNIPFALAVEQAGALCYRFSSAGKLEFLLVASLRSGRWGIPKGHIDPGETTWAAAQREAFEEAGAYGETQTTVFATFQYQKGSASTVYNVTVHPMRIEKMTSDFPELSVRKQVWVSPSKANGLLWNNELKAIFRLWRIQIKDRADTR